MDDRLSHCDWTTDPRYRTVPEHRIRDMLALAGWTFEARETGDDVQRHAADALGRLIAQGLPWGDHAVERHFDPVEVLNFLKWQGLAGKNGFWADRFVPTGRRLVQALAGIAGNGPADFTVTYQRTFGAGSLPLNRPIRLRLPLPVPHPSLLDLRVEDVSAAGLSSRIAADGCRLEMRGVLASAEAVKVSQTLHFTCLPQTQDTESGSDLDLYLAPDEGYVQVTARVRALAYRLSAAADTPQRKVEAFWDFFFDHLCLGAVHYDLIDTSGAATDRVLETGWFDCQVGSALLVALCRACGIPARLVGGALLYTAAPTLHYWAEIWFDDDGWRAFDLACWDLSRGGRDAGWRTRFAGDVDARMTMQRFPLQFTGPSGATLPPAWHVVNASTGIGARTSILAVSDGQLVFDDEISVTARGSSADGARPGHRNSAGSA